ncbi:MAG TPA: zinc ribbon domain-containing protein, partial [Xanthomonadales bacterium]|nr:zinc ribbon domain-containing protein [Xanthomonadales bacterium]
MIATYPRRTLVRMTCPSCQSPIPAGARFCSTCGAPAPQAVAVGTYSEPVPESANPKEPISVGD